MAGYNLAELVTSELEEIMLAIFGTSYKTSYKEITLGLS